MGAALPQCGGRAAAVGNFEASNRGQPGLPALARLMIMPR
jgi:hypothetical protein